MLKCPPPTPLIPPYIADRLPLKQHDKIQAIQEHYAYLLHRYVDHRFEREPNLFARIVMKLADVRDINEIHSDMLLHMKVDELDPLLVEIFELPPPSESEGVDEEEDDGKEQTPPGAVDSTCGSDPGGHLSKSKLPSSESECVQDCLPVTDLPPRQGLSSTDIQQQQLVHPGSGRFQPSGQALQSNCLTNRRRSSTMEHSDLSQDDLEVPRPMEQTSPSSVPSPTLDQPAETGSTPSLTSPSSTPLNLKSFPSAGFGHSQRQMLPALNSCPFYGQNTNLSQKSAMDFRSSQSVKF